MNKKNHYTFRQKLTIVRLIESGKESIGSASRRLGSSRSVIQQWLGHYRQQGKAGLKLHVGTYNGEFKIKVVEYMLDKGLSLTEACSLFGIPNPHTVNCWKKAYKVHGSHILLVDRRRSKGTEMEPKKKQRKSNLSPEAEQLASLQAEVEWLRAENDFLKKLDALMQEKKARNKQRKEQKPSKD